MSLCIYNLYNVHYNINFIIIQLLHSLETIIINIIFYKIKFTINIYHKIRYKVTIIKFQYNNNNPASYINVFSDLAPYNIEQINKL